VDGLLRLEGAGILPRAYMIRSTERIRTLPASASIARIAHTACSDMPRRRPSSAGAISPGGSARQRRTSASSSLQKSMAAAITRLTFPAFVPVGISRRGRSAALLERLPIDVDEDDGLLPSWTIDPDGGGHRRRPRIAALPHAASRPTIRAAARQRALAFCEAVLREGGQDLFRGRHPPALRLDPRHPAVTPQLRQTAHLSHVPTLEVRPSRGYWTKVPCRLALDGRLRDGVARVEPPPALHHRD